ncbi:MAG: F0F1 ATP synthase subunit A [Candidatus Electryonea clarkiae]|nr:F0F1 ATP synthase subunit A [Candidatus Electryonea clarkiae]MDP8286315.1 F0F1 ATP synthase subunit A [Candidatus Electryonea clarkiae]
MSLWRNIILLLTGAAAAVAIVAVCPNSACSEDLLAMVVTDDNGKTKPHYQNTDDQHGESTETHSDSKSVEKHSGVGSTSNPDEPHNQVKSEAHTGSEVEDAHSSDTHNPVKATSHDNESDAHGEHDASGVNASESHDEHGEEESGGGVTGYLAHHLVDQETYDLPWASYNLPKIQVSTEFAKKYPEFVKTHHGEHGGESYYIPVTKHMLGLIIAALLVIVLVIPGMGRTRRGEVPHGFGNFLEVLVVFVRDEVVFPNMGKETGRKWTPFFLTAFFLILFSNLMGMVPWGTSATGNVNITAGLAIAMLLSLLFAGFKQHGIKFIATFIPHGVPWPVVILLFPIEIFGLFVKHFALCIRLFANMLAGHTVIGVFIALILSPFVAFASVPGAVAISMLELFVAFLQAYIFVMLSSLFIGSTIHPSH